MNGRSFQFLGDISDLQIREGILSDALLRRKKTRANALKDRIVTDIGVVNVTVNLLPDESHARLQPIKDIMNAVGVQKLDDLATLQLVTRTVKTPGKVTVAHRKMGKADWGSVASKFIAGSASDKKRLLTTHLANQNSVKTLESIASVEPVTPVRKIPRVGRGIQPFRASISRVWAVTPVAYRLTGGR